MTFLKSNVVKTMGLKDNVTIAQLETIRNIWNGNMFGDIDWHTNALRRFVSISWSCYFMLWLFKKSGCWKCCFSFLLSSFISQLLVLLFEVLDYMTTSTIIIIITCHLLRYRVAVKMLASWFIRRNSAAVFCTFTVKMHVEYVSLTTFAQNWNTLTFQKY